LKVLALAVAAVLLGRIAYRRHREWAAHCCNIYGGTPGDVLVCEHSKTWRHGRQRAGSLGPWGYALVPGWYRITNTRGLRYMEAELDGELAAFAEVSEED
jgi:hypothetical protein